MFRRKFGYESEDYPKFSDLVREDDLDTEVHCTGFGFTKEMEKDLLEEYGMQRANDTDDDDEEEEEDKEEEEEIETEKNEIAEYQKQLENEIKYSEAKPATKITDTMRRYIESCTQYLSSIQRGSVKEIIDDNEKTNILQQSTTETKESSEVEESHDNDSVKSDYLDALSINSNDLETDDMPELINVDKNSRLYRLKMVEKLLNDARSQRSFSTTTSTIAPSVITERIKRNMDIKEKRDMRKRCVVKGEANSVHRNRKEKKNIVKEYAVWDF